MKIVIAGSRGFEDYTFMKNFLDNVIQIDADTEIVSGAARGADRLGELYARENKLECSQFPADWNKYGKSAGYRRNTEMAEYADGAIVFWDGESHGSIHEFNENKRLGKPCLLVNYVNGQIVENNGFEFFED